MSLYRSNIVDALYYVEAGHRARRESWHKDSYIYIDKDIIIKVRMGTESVWRPSQDDIRHSDWGFIVCASK